LLSNPFVVATARARAAWTKQVLERARLGPGAPLQALVSPGKSDAISTSRSRSTSKCNHGQRLLQSHKANYPFAFFLLLLTCLMPALMPADPRVSGTRFKHGARRTEMSGAAAAAVGCRAHQEKQGGWAGRRGKSLREPISPAKSPRK